MPDFILALDQGTTSSRAIVFNREGKQIASAQREFRQIFPKPGWVEHDPMDIWNSQISVALEAVAKASLHPTDLAGIGIANQRETAVIWDRKTGQPIHNAIVWQDRRTAGACQNLKSAGAERIVREKTGLVIDSYFSATKLAWILDNVPGARRRAEAGELAFGTIDTWLLWKLTGGNVHATDFSNASRTMLFDIHTGQWDDELLTLLKVPKPGLPQVRPSSGDFGLATGDLSGIKITGIAGDQQAALFGQACYYPGMAKNTYGTGCFLLQHIGKSPAGSKHGLLTTIAWQLNGRIEYALEGSVFIAGAIVQWLRDGLGIIKSSDEIEALAASVPDSAGVVLVPALVGLGAPHWDSSARGLIVGLTRGVGRGHIARAALEAIAYQAADLIDAMSADSGNPLPELRVDGGGAVNGLLMQFQSDLLGIPVVCCQNPQTTALGAAYLAGIGAGLWKDTDQLSRLWQPGRRFEPTISRETAFDLRQRWNQAVERAKGWDNR